MNSTSTPENYLVVDFEATCCEDNSFPASEMEIIEIGALIVQSGSFKTLGEFQTFVRPARNKILNPFCTKLTSITQHEVDWAPLFPLAAERWKKWMDGFGVHHFCAWGDYDLKQLQMDCAHHKIKMPISAPYLNLRKKFSEKRNPAKRFHLQEALVDVGLKFEGRAHRGIDDARNSARLLPFIFAAGR